MKRKVICELGKTPSNFLTLGISIKDAQLDH